MTDKTKQAPPTFEGDEAEVRRDLELVGDLGQLALSLLDAKAEAIARLCHDLALTDRDQARLVTERDEALARAERAEQALAERDAAIVEAVPLLQLLRSKLSIPDEINALLARLDTLLPAPELNSEAFDNVRAERDGYGERMLKAERERGEALAAKERAEQALADRDAAIVEADKRRANRASYAECFIHEAADYVFEPLRLFLPAPEPVDPLVEALESVLPRGQEMMAGSIARDLREKLPDFFI